ncbi:MAG: hypothetical protein OHK0037_09040 [Elainellaceae cyanobacterium]
MAASAAVSSRLPMIRPSSSAVVAPNATVSASFQELAKRAALAPSILSVCETMKNTAVSTR